MATNKYFNNFPNRPNQEQSLIEDLIIETIKIWGQDVYYVPRDSQDVPDLLYGEDPVSQFTSAYVLEMYLSNVMGPQGPSEFFNKFGYQIIDTNRFIVARRIFNQRVPTLVRPREGDLIFVPLLNDMFEIKFVDQDKAYALMGRKPPLFISYELVVEEYKFSNEKFATGVELIDSQMNAYSYTINLNLLPSTNTPVPYDRGEIVYQGANVASATAKATVKDWIRSNNVLQVMNIKGTFANGANVIGSVSNANWYVSNTYNRIDFSGVTEQTADNLDIQTQANAVIDFSTTNPFGEPT